MAVLLLSSRQEALSECVIDSDARRFGCIKRVAGSVESSPQLC
jgi:hypothetical protein